MLRRVFLNFMEIPAPRKDLADAERWRGHLKVKEICLGAANGTRSCAQGCKVRLKTQLRRMGITGMPQSACANRKQMKQPVDSLNLGDGRERGEYWKHPVKSRGCAVWKTDKNTWPKFYRYSKQPSNLRIRRRQADYNLPTPGPCNFRQLNLGADSSPI